MVLLELRTTRSCPARHSPRGRLNGESRRHPSPCQASPATEHTTQILSFGTPYTHPQQGGDHSTFRPNKSKPREGLVARPVVLSYRASRCSPHPTNSSRG